MTWTICWILLADGVVLTAALHRNDSGGGGGGEQPACRRYSVSNRPSQDCSSLGLSALPALFADVIALNLANNTFPVIEHFPTSYSNLHTLILDNCAIRKISAQALSSLRNVRVLILSRNLLTSITFGAEAHVISTLNLAHNYLRFVPDLSGLHSLRFVDLSHNTIEAVKPSYLPPNVESLRLTANRITHLTPWPFLRNLQELDVSLNPLECACPLWEFVGWAESLALLQEEALPCERPKSLRRSLVADYGQMICGPEVFGAPYVDQSTLSIGEQHRMCCLISAYPKPTMWWEHEHYANVSEGVIQRRVPESGRIEFCLHIASVAVEDLGVYRCFAQLEQNVAWKEFQVRRSREPLVLKSSTNIIFYCQFSIGMFIFAFCCATCCILRRGRPSKTALKEDNSRRSVMQVMADNGEAAQATTHACCNHIHHYSPVAEDYCLLESPEENTCCLTTDYPYAEAYRRLYQAPEDPSQRRITLWRHRIAAMPAPLAQFDKETNIMSIVHTSV